MGRQLTSLCYFQEGDNFLCVTTYDEWHEVLRFLKNADRLHEESNICLPTLFSVVNELISDVDEAKEALIVTLAKTIPVYRKMFYDINNRMRQTLGILRACRLFNYEFVAKTPELALRDELYQLQHLAAVDSNYLSILTEDYVNTKYFVKANFRRKLAASNT